MTWTIVGIFLTGITIMYVLATRSFVGTVVALCAGMFGALLVKEEDVLSLIGRSGSDAYTVAVLVFAGTLAGVGVWLRKRLQRRRRIFR